MAIDVGVDIIHPQTTLQRLGDAFAGRPVRPQYAGVGLGRNATLASQIPGTDRGYILEQQTYIEHDLAVRASGGTFADLGNPAVALAHADLAADNPNLVIKGLFGGLALAGQVVGAYNQATGSKVLVGSPPGAAPVVGYDAAAEAKLTAVLTYRPTASGGGAAVQHVTAATGAQAPAAPLLTGARFSIPGPAYPTAIATPGQAVLPGPTGSQCRKG